MENVTSPIECYEFLQEAKSKNPARDPPEKIKEVLRLYERTLDILETTRTEMEIKGQLLMYNMTMPEVQDRLSEVFAEKMQLEDYLTIPPELHQFENTWHNHNVNQQILSGDAQADIDTKLGGNKWKGKERVPDASTLDEDYEPSGTTSIEILSPSALEMPLPHLGFSRLQQIYVESALYPQSLSRPYGKNKRERDWDPINTQLDLLSQSEFQPFVNIFTYLTGCDLAAKMFIYSYRYQKLVGFRDTRFEAATPLQIEVVRALLGAYAKQCKKLFSVVSMEIYRSPDDDVPVLTIESYITDSHRTAVAKNNKGEEILKEIWSS